MWFNDPPNDPYSTTLIHEVDHSSKEPLIFLLSQQPKVEKPPTISSYNEKEELSKKKTRTCYKGS